MTKTIYLHIGMSKTGSTSVQKMFSKHADYFAQNDLYYPKSCRNDISHHTLAEFFKFEKYAEKARDLANEILLCQHSRILLSSELFEHMNPLMWQRAMAFFRPHKLKVIIYLRRQDDAMISIYNELVKKHALKTSFNDFIQTSPLRDNFNYRKMLGIIEQQVGLDNMLVGLFCQATLEEGNICPDLLHKIDKNVLLPKVYQLEKENSSLSPATAQVMATINRNTDFNINHTTHYGLACQFASILNTELSQQCHTQFAYFGSLEARQHFIAQYQASNDYISSRYLKGTSFNPELAETMMAVMSDKDEKLLLDVGLVLVKRIFEKKYGTSDGIAKMIGVLWNSELQSQLKSHC
jgi:hypothetical protein